MRFRKKTKTQIEITMTSKQYAKLLEILFDFECMLESSEVSCGAYKDCLGILESMRKAERNYVNQIEEIL